MIRELSQETFAAYHALFEECQVTCFCNYWHFEGTKNEWLERCAFDSQTNAREVESRVLEGSPEARGLLFIDEGRALGWMKLVPRATLPKMTRLPVYKSLDLGDGDTTYAIACMLVHPEFRGKGIARALLRAAPAFVSRWGGEAIQAFPRRSTEALYPEEVWQGPEGLFRAEQYEPLHDVPPYPVFRKVVR